MAISPAGRSRSCNANLACPRPGLRVPDQGRKTHEAAARGYPGRAPPFALFLGDMEALGVTPVPAGGVPYAVVAARSNPRWWLLPLDNRRAAAAGLEMLQPVTRAAQLAKLAARGIARLGPAGWLGRGQLRLSGLPDLAGALDGRAAHVACFTGTDGPASQDRAAGDGRDRLDPRLCQAVARAPCPPLAAQRGRDAGPCRRDGSEDRRCPRGAGLARRRGPDAAGDGQPQVPRPCRAAPARRGAPRLPRRSCARAAAGDGAGPLLDGLERRMGALAGLAGPDWTARLSRACALLRPVADTIPVCLGHGDFTPWNTFLQGGRLYVFDWEYAAENGPVGQDLAHFLLSTTPPATIPDSGAALTRALAEAHFGGDDAPAARALLLSLACHAVFYLGRLDEAGSPLADWPEGPARAALIDRLLAEGTEGAR